MGYAAEDSVEETEIVKPHGLTNVHDFLVGFGQKAARFLDLNLMLVLEKRHPSVLLEARQEGGRPNPK